MMKIRTLMLATAVALAIPAVGLAQGISAGGFGPGDGAGFGRGGPMQFDTNEDGTITRAEVDSVRAERLASADVDGDGAISLEEFEAMAEARRAERLQQAFDRLDADGDGIVSDDEFVTMADVMFDRLDANEDGEITPDEQRMRGGPGWRRGDQGPRR